MNKFREGDFDGTALAHIGQARLARLLAVLNATDEPVEIYPIEFVSDGPETGTATADFMRDGPPIENQTTLMIRVRATANLEYPGEEPGTVYNGVRAWDLPFWAFTSTGNQYVDVRTMNPEDLDPFQSVRAAGAGTGWTLNCTEGTTEDQQARPVLTLAWDYTAHGMPRVKGYVEVLRNAP
jgi:hypothetical protein